MFYSFIIHNQNYKKSAHSRDIYQENLDTKFNKVSWWTSELEILEIFAIAFVLQVLLFELEFFSSNAECSPQKPKEKFKKDSSYPKIARHNKRKNTEKEKQKRDRKTENKKKSQAPTINIFLLLLFYTEKFMLYPYRLALAL